MLTNSVCQKTTSYLLQEDEHRRQTVEEKSLKKSLVRRKEADARRRKLWGHIVRKEVPRVSHIFSILLIFSSLILV